MNKKSWIIICSLVFLALVFGFAFYLWKNSQTVTTDVKKRVVINEAVRTLLYLPLYNAIEKGYFKENGIEVEVVTGGTATNSFAAMLSGEADFSQADPMYVPISREKGSETRVVAQVVGRIAIWGVTLNPEIKDMSAQSLRGKKISTQPKPMSAFTYTLKAIQDVGLVPDKDVEVITSTPGTEIVPLLNKQADFAMTVEPNVSKVIAQGGHVVLSYPNIAGDQILTGLMAKESYIKENPETVLAVVRAYQKSLDDIRANPKGSLDIAKKYFPQLDENTLVMAIQRLAEEEVFPKQVIVSEDSWNKAIKVRVEAGDLRSQSSREQNCEINIMQKALSQ